MQTLLIDTNVLSYLFKQDTRGAQYFERHLRGNYWAASFMTLAELEAWTLRHQWGEKRRQALNQFIQRLLVLPFDRLLCQQWARVTEQRRASGLVIDCADAWIAATALLYRLPLVTHNVRDYQGIQGLDLFSL